MTAPLLECNQLTKRFGNKVALDHVDLSLDSGQIVGLLGPNGSGKTTLIKTINGLLTPTEGKVLIYGNPPGVASKKIISYLPEQTYLRPWMKIEDIVQFFGDFYTDFSIPKAYSMLERLGLDPKSRLKTLSKGSKEKVQLTLVMCREADLYILDEPIGGVDPAARDFILHTILNNYREDATILISTHLIADIETILDRVVFLKDGHVVKNQTVDEIRSSNHKSVDTLFREVYRC